MANESTDTTQGLGEGVDTDGLQEEGQGQEAGEATAPADVLDDVGSDSPDGAEGSEGSEEKRKSGLEGRFAELTARAKGAEERAEAAERQLDEFRSRQAFESGESPLAKHIEAKPSLADFDFDAEKYEEAFTKWVEDGNAIHSRISQEREAQAKAGEMMRRVEADGARRHGDFDVVVKGPGAPSYVEAPFALGAILESEMGGELAYRVAKDPEFYASLAGLSPAGQARKIVEMEIKLKAQPRQETPATEPTTQLKSGASGGGKPDPAKMSTDQWMKWRQRQLRDAS